MKPAWRLPAGLLLVTALVLGLACGRAPAPPAPTATPATSLDPATATAPPEPLPTEDPALIAPVVESLGSAQPDAIRQFIGFEQLPCSAAPAEQPACAPREQEGHPVDAFYFADCAGYYLRAAETGRALDIMAEAQLYAVYRLPPAAQASGQYSVILVDQRAPRVGQAWEAIIDNERIVALIYSCTATPARLVELRRYTDAVIPPSAP